MRETVLVTGASAGIGAELARAFAREPSDLVLVARREQRLEALADELEAGAGVSARVLCADLSDPSAPERIAAGLAERGATVDVLVNNAGFGARGPFARASGDRIAAMLAVNVTALTRLTRLLLPGMVERGRGGVLNVASTAAFQAGPFMAAYYATKAYVLSFSEALHEETRGTGVTVTCLCPGPTRTEFQDVADMSDSLLFRLAAQDAAPVARAGVRGLRRGKAVVIPGLGNKAGAFATRLVPRALLRRAVRAVQS